MLSEERLIKNKTRKQNVTSKKCKKQRTKNNHLTINEQIECFAEIIANHVLKNTDFYEDKK